MHHRTGMCNRRRGGFGRRVKGTNDDTTISSSCSNLPSLPYSNGALWLDPPLFGNDRMIESSSKQYRTKTYFLFISGLFLLLLLLLPLSRKLVEEAKIQYFDLRFSKGLLCRKKKYLSPSSLSRFRKRRRWSVFRIYMQFSSFKGGRTKTFNSRFPIPRSPPLVLAPYALLPFSQKTSQGY